jgi:uncharacterized protein
MTSRAETWAEIEAWVRQRLEANPKTAHGWLHIDRVRRSAIQIAREEDVDPWLAALAALIHDVGRTAPGPGSEHGRRSAEMAAPMFARLGLEAEQEPVLHAVRWHNSTRSDTPLLCVLRDADMLDGLGAIGLLRALMSKHMLVPYDPEVVFERQLHWPPELVADQICFQMTWIERMNTEAGRRLAQRRVAFMRAFAAELWDEVAAGAQEAEEGFARVIDCSVE